MASIVSRFKVEGWSVRTLIGGGAFQCLPHPAEEVGADGFAADLKSALTLLNG